MPSSTSVNYGTRIEDDRAAVSRGAVMAAAPTVPPGSRSGAVADVSPDAA